MSRNWLRRAEQARFTLIVASALFGMSMMQWPALADPPGRGDSLSRQGDTDGIRDAERAVAERPDDRAARLAAARAQFAASEGRPSRQAAAQRHLEVLLASKADDTEALKLMAQIELAKGDVASAVVYYQNAVRFARDDPAANLGLGEALARTGDEAGANAAFAEYRRASGLPPIVEDPPSERPR